MGGAGVVRGGPYEVLVSTRNQELAERIKLLFDDAETRPVVCPAAEFGSSMEVLTFPGMTRRTALCLVLVKGVTADPREFAAWLTGPAERTVLRHCKGFFVLHAAGTWCPTLEDALNDIAARYPKDVPTRLHCYPFAARAAWLPKLAYDVGITLSTLGDAATLQIVEVPGRGVHWWAVRAADAACAWRPPVGFAALPPGVSRAAAKVLDALAVADAIDPEAARAARDGWAIDVGAAPGAWTQHLAARYKCVVAIDPSPLEDSVAALPGVAQVRAMAGRGCQASGGDWDEVRGRVLAAAAEGGVPGGSLASCVACDVNAVPNDVVSVLQHVLPLVRLGGLVVVTLKFLGRGAGHGIGAGGLLRGLGEGWVERAKCVWLMSNTQRERTMVAWRGERTSAAWTPCGVPRSAAWTAVDGGEGSIAGGG
ncbi:unnamed protein product [Pedinophyceae sp. YPF-701]|nr:unnamed protein product [Pedinophyceae sp. YPF-701]